LLQREDSRGSRGDVDPRCSMKNGSGDLEEFCQRSRRPSVALECRNTSTDQHGECAIHVIRPDEKWKTLGDSASKHRAPRSVNANPDDCRTSRQLRMLFVVFFYTDPRKILLDSNFPVALPFPRQREQSIRLTRASRRADRSGPHRNEVRFLPTCASAERLGATLMNVTLLEAPTD